MNPPDGARWRSAALGTFLVLITALLGLPLPVLERFLIDHVVLGGRFNLALWVRLAMAVSRLVSMVSNAYHGG